MTSLTGHKVITTAIIVSGIAVISKIIGFAREAIIASYFGANSFTDAFFVAQSMPALIFPAVCTSLSTAFISLYVSKSVKNNNEAYVFASRAITGSLYLALVLSGIAYIITPYIIKILVPGFDRETTNLTIHLTRLIMSCFVFTMAHYMLSAILNAKKKFYAVQVAGLAYSISIIVVTIALGQGQSVEQLTITVIGGHLIQTIMLLFFVIRYKIAFRIITNPFNKEFKALLSLSVPILLGNSVVQVNSIVAKALASTLGSGAISAISYATTLRHTVITIVVTPLSTVLYPTLAENISSGDAKSYSTNLYRSALLLIMVLLPITILSILLATDVISFVFERGSFDKTATKMTATVLAYYAIGFAFIGLRETLIRGFYANKNTKIPAANSAISAGLNVLFSIILVQHMGIAGIALGSVLSNITSTLLLILSLKDRVPVPPLKNSLSSVVKMILAGAVTAMATFAFINVTQMNLSWMRLSLTSVFSIGVYFIVLLFLRCDEVTSAMRFVKKRMPKIIYSHKVS